MDTWYDMRIEQGEPPYTLKATDSFDGTDELGTALNEFFEDDRKGIHVAIICAENVSIHEDYLLSLFRRSLPDSCTELIKICEVPSEEKYKWKEGRYWHYEELSEGVAAALQILLECAGKLKINIDNATTIQSIYKMSENSGVEMSDIWTHTNAKLFSSFLLSPSKIREGCANIRILLVLPVKYFEFFQVESYHFPSVIEYVVRGIPSSERITNLEHKIKHLESSFSELLEMLKKLKQLSPEKFGGEIDVIKIMEEFIVNLSNEDYYKTIPDSGCLHDYLRCYIDKDRENPPEYSFGQADATREDSPKDDLANNFPPHENSDNTFKRDPDDDRGGR